MVEKTGEVGLTREEVLARVSAQQQELRARFGVTSLALFGSTARNLAGSTSDIDLLVAFERPVSLFHFFALQDYLEALLDGHTVDLVLRDSVLDSMRERVTAEAISVVSVAC